MFAVSTKEQQLSPYCMKFCEIWIYDLRIFHSFWHEKIKNESIGLFPSAWSAVLNFYQINFFSPISQLEAFAKDYHSHFKTKNTKNSRISKSSIDKVFQHFKRLGIHRVGHLKKIPFEQIQKRFGKSWRIFFEGVLEPEDSDWAWESYRKTEQLEGRIEPDYALTSVEQINSLCFQKLQDWSNNNSSIFVEKLTVYLSSFDTYEDEEIDLFFSNRPELGSQLKWIQRVLEERLQNIQMSSPISCIRIKLEPSFIKKSVQLTLFEDKNASIEWQQACERLMALGFPVFQPENTNSYCPEDSWKKGSPDQRQVLSPHISFRPLVQFYPQAITKPDSPLSFTERIEYFDSEGRQKKRDYFIQRKNRYWSWVFENEEGDWFEQGIVE